MQQGAGISYDVILKQRDLYPEDCTLDGNKIKEVNEKINKYKADRAEEKKAEEEEFAIGPNKAAGANN